MKYFLVCITLLGLSCAKEHSCENCAPVDSYKKATIIYGGPVTSDGCGWLIKTDDTHIFHPDVLTANFQQDQLPVRIIYELTPDKFICGISAAQIPVIRVIDIQL